MKQVFLTGGGSVEILEVPVPARLPGSVLVRSACSVISTGTEISAVSDAPGWLGIGQKILQSTGRAQQAWDLARSQGILRTWETVQRKLGEFTPLGYSVAGWVVETDDETLPLRAGAPVACMGVGFACHAEYNVVPRNLLVSVPEGVALEHACFGALGCIATHGIRRLEMSPGERIGVIGLGLVGQICIRLLVGMGYRAYGIDLDPTRAATAAAVPGVEAWAASDEDSVRRVHDATLGGGLDGVVVCASGSSDRPVNLAFDLCRQRGRVSLVGDVGLGLDRRKMYRKEVELRLSCSYGPGRHDPGYELEGQDYPIGYVRWTERRNLEYFLELLAAGSCDLGPLVNKRFPVEEAPSAYDLLKQGGRELYGVLIDYGAGPHPASVQTSRSQSVRAGERPALTPRGAARIGLIGCGAFARGVLIPNLAKLPDRFHVAAVASRTGRSAAGVGKSCGAEMVTSDHKEILRDPTIDAVLIATRHSSHAALVLEALDAGKHVFVEKPMAITVEDALRIVAVAESKALVVRVGFNRRFSPQLNAMRLAVGSGGRRMLTCRVNVGALNGHWSQAPEEGGRLLGEGVHFFDLCNWFIGAEPNVVSATMAGEATLENPDCAVTVSYADGSIGQVVYSTLGHSKLGKEYYEALGNGKAAVCDDFRLLRTYGDGARASRRGRGDKGHLGVLKEFSSALRGGSGGAAGADSRAGLIALWMANAVYCSAKEQCSVRLDL